MSLDGDNATAVLVCLADVPIRPRRRFASIRAMARALAEEHDATDPAVAVIVAVLEEDEEEFPACAACGHSYAQEHRIIPGAWGGTYHPSNVVHLCPNHHAMVHLRMKYHVTDRLTEGEWNRLDDAMHDPGVNRLWAARIKAVCLQREADIERRLARRRAAP